MHVWLSLLDELDIAVSRVVELLKLMRADVSGENKEHQRVYDVAREGAALDGEGDDIGSKEVALAVDIEALTVYIHTQVGISNAVRQLKCVGLNVNYYITYTQDKFDVLYQTAATAGLSDVDFKGELRDSFKLNGIENVHANTKQSARPQLDALFEVFWAGWIKFRKIPEDQSNRKLYGDIKLFAAGVRKNTTAWRAVVRKECGNVDLLDVLTASKNDFDSIYKVAVSFNWPDECFRNAVGAWFTDDGYSILFERLWEGWITATPNAFGR